MRPANRWNLPNLGIGVGLRSNHYDHVVRKQPQVDWFELISENFMAGGGRPLRIAEQVAASYPLVLHGVSLSIGSTDPLDFEYLRRLKDLSDRLRPVWLGDHICWTGVAGHNSHDLLPLPYDEATLAHVVARVRQVQDFLERPLVLENASTYLEFAASSMPEQEFVARLAEAADCALLLDVNNVWVNHRNHGTDPIAYLDAMPYDRVVQIHVAGHADKGTHCIDTHEGPVIDPVWELLAEVEKRAPGRSILLEWDTAIPEFDVVLAEARKAERFLAAESRSGRAAAAE
ncbi:MAG TPA: DUF692 domain-containing protein [Planctomycetota bacterium]